VRRRKFLTSLAGLTTWPFGVHAEQAAIPAVGFLSSLSAAALTAPVAAFRGGLQSAGYTEGKNVEIEFRWADGRYDRLPALAAVSTEVELDQAFANFRERDIGGFIVVADPFFVNRRDQIISSAARGRFPGIYFLREFAESGGLASYGSNLAEAYRQAGIYAGKILTGVKPNDLPVVQPTKFDLVINLKTAKALGLNVPPSLLAIADEVIE
jgi:putative tryptophan/tyrosine transport system substrate-binding protein